MASPGLRLLTFATIVRTFIPFTQIVSSIEGNSVAKYGKLATNYAENLTSVEVTKYVPQSSPDLATFVHQIAELYIPEKLVCIIAGNATQNYNIDFILKEISTLETVNVIVMIAGGREFDMRHVFQKPNGYILVGTELPEVLETLVGFGGVGSTWNPRGLWISVAESKEDAARIMKSLWENFVYKVIVLVIRGNTSDATEAYTWRPYYPYTYCGPPISRNLVRLGTFTKTSKFKKETDLQPGMIPEKFGNCWINVSFIPWEPYVYPKEKYEKYKRVGIETRLIQMVYDKIGLNMKSHYRPALLDSMDSEASAGSHMPRSSILGRWDVSQPYFEGSTTWILRRRGKSHGLEGIISRFSPELWGSTGIAMLVVAATLMAAGNRHWALNVWGSFWEQSSDRLPRNTRRIWICWLLLCLHLAAAYRTALVSHLTNPLIHQISSIEELVDDEDLNLGLLIQTEEYLDEKDEIAMKILARYIPCETIEKCYMEIPEGRAVLTDKMHANYLSTMENVTLSMLENIHYVPDHFTYKVSMFYAKGHAVSPIFDKYVLMLLQAGFVDHLVRETEFLQKIIDARKRDFTEKKPLSFADVREGFYLLAVGLTVAGLSFLYEIFGYLSKKRILIKIDK